MTPDPETHCGFVAIAGRPNVGKSTLLNRILGQKISITARRPQTTRHRILGIETEGPTQVVYVDTPGLRAEAKRAMERYMYRAALSGISDVDAIIFVVEGLRWTRDDARVLERLRDASCPLILAINKVDTIKSKQELLPYIDDLSKKADFTAVVPLSAKTGENLDELKQCVRALLPRGPHFFPPEQITDRNERFLAAELIREKLTRRLGQELPYALTVEIEEFKTRDEALRISAAIWVERPGQKAMVIGADGQVLKAVGTQARQEMERLFGCKVHLRLWVKVREGWSDDERALKSLGYTDE